MFLKIFFLLPALYGWVFWNFSEKYSHAYPTIHVIGDVMLSRSVGAMTKTHGTEYITQNFHPFARAKKNDFLFLNLESPFSKYDRDIHRPSFTFASNVRNIKILSWLTDPGIGIISLANNHILNAGFEGLETTITLLDEAKILYTWISKWERVKFLEIEKNSKKFCFWAYTYDGQKYFNKKTGETWWVNSLEDAKKDIFEMRKANCNEKIFSLHWGREYKVEPTEKQKRLAYFLVDNGATMIIGAHSHILWKKEQYKGKWIFYSLGNAIFDQEWGRDGCEKSMDCIFDEKLWKQVVPTYIWTRYSLDFPYNTDVDMEQWDIKIWTMIKR